MGGPGNGVGISDAAAEIADIATPICVRKSLLKDLAIISAARDPDTVVVAHHRREIANDHGKPIAIPAASEIGNYALLGVAAINPLESIRLRNPVHAAVE